MRVLISLLTLFVAVLAAAPTHAGVYKWVDQNGVTNYSGKPPIDAAVVKKVDSVAQRISVYTPDTALTLAMAAGPKVSERILSDRIDSLERQLEAERRARQVAAAAERQAAQTAYERCVAERRVDCNGGHTPYPPAVVVAIPRPQTRFVPRVAVTGVAAGKVTRVSAVGGASFKRPPGAFSRDAFPPRSASAARMGGRFASR